MKKLIMRVPKKKSSGDDSAGAVGETTPAAPALSVVTPAQTPKKKRSLNVIPELECNTCAIGQECYKYAPGYVCAFEGAFDTFGRASEAARHNAHSVGEELDELRAREMDVTDVMEHVLRQETRRYNHALLIEKVMNNGAITPEVTNLGNSLIAKSQAYLEMSKSNRSLTITAEGSAARASGGILAKLFGTSVPQPQGLEINPPEHSAKVVIEMSDDSIVSRSKENERK